MITMASLLAEQPALAGVRPIHLERLSYYTRRATFRAGTRIFHEGGHADRFWIIRDGLIRLSTSVPDRGDVLVETLGAGDVLGWSWLFPPHTWQFTAVAVEPCLTIEFDGPGVLRLCQGAPELGYALTTRFLNVLFERLRATRSSLTDIPRAVQAVLGEPVLGTPVLGTPVLGTPVLGTPVLGTPVPVPSDG